ncbi:MAG: metallophosphoesterase, partial [Leptospirales bacterium]|nr:metallophosphoesterase [Leptospirales bacterium]
AFFIVFFTINIIFNTYICVRGLSVLPKIAILRVIFILTIIFLSFSYFTGRLLRGVFLPISDFLILAGSFYLAVMLFLVLALLFIDIIRATNYFFVFFPDFFITKSMLVKRVTAVIVLLAVCAVMVWGRINAGNVIVNEAAITLNKKAGKLKNLKAALISDIHLGLAIREAQIKNIVDLTNAQNADIVFLCGDIFDAGLEELTRRAADILSEFQSRYGTFAVLGNHEYIINAEAIIECMSKNGITVLRDEAVLFADSFYVAGRDDFSSWMRQNKKRLSLDEIIKPLDRSRAIIVLDHQPRELEEAVEAGIDLQLSGHTHAGQIWPLTLLIKSMWELPHGYMKKEGASFFVTSGAGTWGPRLRIGTKSEIAVINIEFE